MAKGAKFRPSTRFLREMLFSIIGFEALSDAIFLDVFAGSGIVGFEALSRGARKAIFLEISRKNTEMIRANAERFGLLSRAIVLELDATKDLSRLSLALEASELIDIVFIDPPFSRPLEVGFLKRVLKHPHYFAEKCSFYLETRFAPKDIPSEFEIVDQRKTSSSILTKLVFADNELVVR